MTRQLEAFAWHSTSDSLYRRRLARTRRRGPPWRAAVEAALHARGGAYVVDPPPPPPPDFSGRNPPSMLPFRSCVNAAAFLGTHAGTPRAAGSTGSRSPNPETPPAPSTDETLSDLRITGTPVETQLTPEFASNTRSYTARVANSAARITVRPTTNHPGASVEYLDGSNNTVADADDSAGGHQVNVAEGDNTIKVKVTAEDGTTTRTYTVRFSRTPSITLWSATLNVKDVATGTRGCQKGGDSDVSCSNSAVLSHDDFTVGDREYEMERIFAKKVSGSSTEYRLSVVIAPNPGNALDNLTLHAEDTEFAFPDTFARDAVSERVIFKWGTDGYLWSVGDSVPLRLTGAGITAALESPQTVDGVGDSIRYQLDLKLSEPVWIFHAEMRDHAFDVTNGTVVKAKRVARFQWEHQGRRRMFSDHWRITVEPTDPDENVTVVLQGKNCNQRGAVCNPYGDGLLTSPSIELEAPEVELHVSIGDKINVGLQND